VSESIEPAADGLDLSNLDSITGEEVAAFRDYYERVKGESMPALEFWLEFRPDVMKRYRAGVRHTTSEAERDHPLLHAMAMLHFYAVTGYEDGINYEVKLCREGGATKAEILDLLAVAFIHGSPRGMRYVAGGATARLREWVEPEPTPHWPDGWSFDPAALRSGADFSSQEVSTEDIELIIAWYRKTLGEVPEYVTFLARNRPGLLKGYRSRFEHAIRDALPVQMMAYALLNMNVAKGFSDGIRESVLLGRALGMTRPQLLDSICWGFFYGGMDAIGIASSAAADLLDTIDQRTH
jgi:alkylhydroperoxidase/carboxymuconolactone decarboxylase family protein YurZ